MPTPTTVSALVPTYNRADYLGECLDALLGQSSPPEQVIVIDDGSTDETRRIVERYGDRIEYEFQENAGKSAALNRGLQRATQDAIWIFDDDDIAVRDALQRLRTALDDAPQNGFAFGRHDNFSVSENGTKTFIPADFRPKVDVDKLFFELLHRDFIFQPAMLVRRSCYDEVGPFDVAFARAQDYEMLLRLAGAFKAAFIDDVLFHQRQHFGDRGPAALRISGHEVWQRQGAFDDRAIAKILSITPLEAYLPWSDRTVPPTSVSLPEALLWRSAFLTQRGDVVAARRDVEDASRSLKIAGGSGVAETLERAWGPLCDRTARAPNLVQPRRLKQVVEAIGCAELSRYTAQAMSRRAVSNAALALRSGRLRRTTRSLRMWWMFRRGAG